MKKKQLRILVLLSKTILYGLAVQIFCLTTLLAAEGTAQQYQSIMETKIKVKLENASVEQIFSYIERNTSFKFFYDQEVIDQNVRFSINKRNVLLSDLLLEISRDASLKFKQINNVINVNRTANNQINRQDLIEVIIQTRTVNGRVTSFEDDEGLPGVNVVERGTSNGTVTDLEGNYTLTVNEGATLVFSSVGYTTEEVAIGERSVVNLAMTQDIQQLQELVVVGYGTQKKKSLTGSVNSVDAEELNEVKVPNSTQLLQGRVPGVITKQSSGLPGQDGANISIRGFGNPLVLVDGMERNLANIDPNDIESISVLKDASAAIYGARSGNGVILVTTKRGTKGEPQFSYDGSYSWQQFTQKPEVVTDAGIYSEFWNEAEINMGVPTTYTEDEVQNYKDGIPGYESYDWYDFALNQWTPLQQHNLSVNGGGDAITYFAGLGYTDQGSVISSGDFYYKRYNMRSNVNAKISENLSASLDFDYTYEFQRKVPQEDGNDVNTMMRSIYKSQPMAPTTFSDTTLNPTSNFQGTHNRLYGNTFAEVGGTQDLERNIMTANFYLDYNIPGIEGLSTNLRFIYRTNELRNNTFRKAFPLHQRDPDTGDYTQIGTFGANNKNLLNIRDRRFTRIKPIYQLRYNRELQRHSFDALLIAQYIGENTNQIVGQTENLLSDELPYLNFGDPVFHRLDQFVTENGRTSFAGRFKYGFLDKYLIEATFRADASSFFPPDSRWGFFPSVSAGWVLTEEDFLQGSEFLNFMKLRLSYSKTGYDQNAIPYDYFTGYDVFTTPPFLFGSNQYRRLRSASLPNSDMTWEDMTIYNAGVDATMLEGKLMVQLDAFYRKRTNILAIPQSAFPSTFGAILPRDNLNSSDNRGFELMLTYENQTGDFFYRVSGNMTLARSKWIRFEEEDYDTEAEIRVFKRSGTWTNRSVGYVTDGIFRSQQEIDSHPLDQDQNENQTIIPGDIKYVDLNGDGILTWEDQQEIGWGTGNPELNFGFNFLGRYKNFSLSVLLQGGSMYSGNVSGLARLPFNNASTPFMLHWENRFHPEKNPDGTLPLVTLGVRENNNRFSDFWLRDITYLRIENVRLTYNLPEFIQGIGIDRWQAYISANNLYAFSNLGIYKSSFDPEAQLTHNDYPPNRTISLGMNISF